TINHLKTSERTLEQKVAERTAELDEKHRKYHSVIQNNGEGFWRLDGEGRVLEVNPACTHLSGYSEAELIGMTVTDLEVKGSREEKTERLHKLMQQGKYSFETQHRRKDGSAWDVEVNATFIDEDGGYFVAFFKDITERKQAELKSRLLVTIVQSSDDAIISKTLSGIVTSWNTGAEAMFGYSAEEMIGNSMLKLFPAERVDEETSILNQIAQGQRVSHFETVRIRKDGSAIDVSVSLSPIFDEAGKIVGTSKIVRDITHNKQLEQDLQAAKQTAETANQSKSEFLANMSHEIRTPMNAILGLARLASETELTPKQQDYLNKIQIASQALLGILNDILDLSKIESGRLEIERIEFDPTVMLQNVSDLFIVKAEEQGLEIFLDVSPDIPLTVLGDPLRIRQILSNLVSNAIKFTLKGEIHIRMELIESSNDDLLLRLSVRDTGIGMDESAIERLFQSFSQADASITRKFGGSGLGLAISKQLAELLGGSIDVSSQLGKGSIFSFAVHCGKGQAYDWSLDSHHLHDARVLVIDDQETSCIILKNTLESWQLYAETALSAEQGLQKIIAAEQAGTPFNLLLLDWQMEGMDGLELVQELNQKREKEELAYPPTIIMVTAHNKEQLLQAASDMYAPLDAVLTKPVVPSCLLNTILHVYHYQGKDYHIPEMPIDPYVAAHPLYDAHVLLVEDNKLNQQVASEFLAKAGLRVSIANHGGEAVQRVQEEDFDAVLMDLQMPEMDGFEATRRIREIPACVNLPIIAMTAAAMRHDRKTCLDAGMNDHVAKPINPLELINTLLFWIKPATAYPISPPTAVNPEAWSALADMLPGFKLDGIMLMLHGNQEQLAAMLGAFREQFIDEAATIAVKITAGELIEAKNRLHTLKGAAGNLGAKDLHQACDAMDDQLADNKHNAATLANWVDVFDRTMETIVKMLGQRPSVPFPVEADNTLSKTFAELDTLLNKNGFINDQLLARIKMLLPDDQQENYDMLAQYILDTDYSKAKAVLRTLMDLANG
ncbi:MAG: PAS domain S-box protein, partial [Gammaproteobacteria bacterium]